MPKKEKQAYLDVYATLDDDLDGIEKGTSLTGSVLSKHETRTSTGMLALDLVLGGGLTGGGWYTIFGAEQSCKSTIAMTILASLTKTTVPVCTLTDYEGCVVGSTKITTKKKGVMTFDQLVATYKTNDDGELYSVDLEVLSVDKFFHVTHLINKGIKPITTLTTETGTVLGGHLHPVLTLDTDNKRMVWKYIEDIEVGEIVLEKTTDTVSVLSLLGEERNPKFVDYVDLGASRVVSITSEGHETVYDITIDTTNAVLSHSFFANNIVVHNSTQPDYVENIMDTMGVKGDITTLFGQRDPKTGDWLKKPRIRMYQPDTGEDFFDYVAKLQRLLPDKVLIGEEWFYLYENTKKNQKRLSGSYDKGYFSRTNKFRVPAGNGDMQAIILVDSYPSMLPRAQDVDDPSKAIAMQARMFSDGIKRIKGSLKKKRMCILGVNQLRLKPMVMFGCFYYTCPVKLPDGNSVSIGDIVTQKLDIDVLAFNKTTGCFEPKRVVNWFDNGPADDSTFLSIRTKTLFESSTIEQTLIVTPNHKLLRFMSDMEEHADQFKIGDSLTSPDLDGMSCPSLIISISNYELPKDGINRKFDIEVEDNHNYVICGTVVHNSPEYEPGGEALRFYSDVRVRSRDVVMPKTFGKGKILEEDSVTTDGVDTYRFIKIFGHKNKLSIPYLDGLLRLWIEDSNGKARGFDPAYDTYHYLVATGQITGTRNSLKFVGTPFDGISKVKWLDFKMLVVGHKEDIKAWCKRHRLARPLLIREWCKRQLASGEGLDLHKQTLIASKSRKNKKAVEDED